MTMPVSRDGAILDKQAVESALRDGHLPFGHPSINRYQTSAIVVAAKVRGNIPSSTLANRVKPGGANERQHGIKVDWSLFKEHAAVAEPIVEKSPLEVRNEAFWKRRSVDLAKELAQLTHVLHEVSGLMARDPEPPRWVFPSVKGKKNRAAGLLTISDIHAGEVIKANEIAGLNTYDLDICRERLRRLFRAAIEILPRWASDCALTGIFVALNGDLVSGEIHDELRRSNAITSQEQVWFVADELAAGLTKLADAFDNVFVCITPGNHGRSTLKTHAKGTASLSYDTMVGESLRRYFEHDKRVTVAVSPSIDAVYMIFDWKVLQTHNDAGGGGGQGFAGPMLPILRKGKSVEWMAAQSRIFYDIIVSGHYHTSGNLGKILANGSVVGYSEFAQSIRASPEPPQQWLALIHEKWCMRERTEIKLEERSK